MLRAASNAHGAWNGAGRIMTKQNDAVQTAAGAVQTRLPDYLTKQQLAAELGVSIRTIDNLLLRGLPHLKLTRKLTRFPRVPVEAWLAERQVRRA